jgi:hypothetical protein
LADLCKGLEKSLRKPVEVFWSQNLTKLPSGLAAIEKKVGKKTVVSLHDERFVRPDVTLSQKLLTAFEALRKQGDAVYPARLEDLLKKADVNQDDALLPAALAQPKFAESTQVVAGKSPDLWLAFRNDAQQSVNSEGFLKRLVLLACNESSPEVKLSSLAKQLSKELQLRFMEVWRTHFDLHRKLAFVEMSPAGTKAKPDLILRDVRFPRAEKVLAEQLVKFVEAQKVKGESAYPLSWNQLVELAKPSADQATLQKATTLEPFQGRVMLAFPAMAESPLALTEDAAQLAGSAPLLDLVLSLLVTDESQAVPQEKLSAAKGLHPILKPHFAAAVERFVSSKQMPPGFGALKLNSKWHVFRMKDISSTTSTPAPVTDESKSKSKKASSASGAAKNAAESKSPPEFQMPETFAQDFGSAFDRLSEASRLPGCVSLADLRPALSQYSHDVFNAALIALRKTGEFSLSVVEGRYPLSDAERAACLVVNDTPHLLVRRRTS